MPILLNTTNKPVIISLPTEIIRIAPRGRAEVTERDVDRSDDIDNLLNRGVLRMTLDDADALAKIIPARKANENSAPPKKARKGKSKK